MMFDDPTFDGASYLTVGDRLIEAARERPTLGIALARDRDEAAQTRAWFVGTRVVEAADPATGDVRFEGGAPPLAALAKRMVAGEFGHWFDEVKAGIDSGRLQPLRCTPPDGARAKELPALTKRTPLVDLVTFEASDATPSVRCRGR